MEFEQYLERDILAFLDSKTQHKNSSNIDREEEYGLYLTKDYLKELNYALDNDELTKAKKLFDELKLNYSKLPKKSIERKKIYLLLEKMYDKIQDYVKIKEGKIEIIKQGNSEIQKDRTDKFTEISTKKENEEVNTIIVEPEIVLKRTALPISVGNKSDNSDSKKEKGTENKEVKSDKAMDQNSTKSTIKDNTTGKYYEEKGEVKNDAEIITQNVFVKTDNKNTQPILENTKLKVKNNNTNTINIQSIDTDSTEVNDLENELIESTIHLEQLKTKIIERLIENLHQKLEEKNREQDKKIENIRKDMMEGILSELDKRFGEEKKASQSTIENLKGEILNQAYRQAKNIVTDKDNFSPQNNPASQNNIVHDITPANTKTVFVVHQTPLVEEPKAPQKTKESTPLILVQEGNNYKKISHQEFKEKTKEIAHLERKDKIIKEPQKPEPVITNIEEYNYKTTTDAVPQISKQHSDEKSQKLYEQAIYYMQNNKYEDAAKLFKTIIVSNPKNKAANIRLQECLEKHPKLKIEEQNHNINPDNNLTLKENIKNNILSLVNHEKAQLEKKEHEELTNNKSNDFSKREENYSEENSIEYTENVIPHFTAKVDVSSSKHKSGNEELHQMYEEAIYTMFQNNYDEAAKLFQQILRIRPDNKAARIRLQECLEVISNA